MSNPYEEQPPAQPSPQGPYPPSEQYQPAGQPTPYGPQSPMPYGQQPYGAAPQEHSQGTLILIFGILGIFITIFAPIAWYMGNKAKKEIAASGIHYTNESNISIGRMLGKIFTIIALVSIALTIIITIIVVAVGVSQSGG